MQKPVTTSSASELAVLSLMFAVAKAPQSGKRLAAHSMPTSHAC